MLVPAAFDSQIISDLISVIEQLNSENIDVLIPNFDAELHNFIKIQDELKSVFGIATALPSAEQFEERHKSALSEFGEKYDVDVHKIFNKIR